MTGVEPRGRFSAPGNKFDNPTLFYTSCGRFPAQKPSRFFFKNKHASLGPGGNPLGRGDLKLCPFAPAAGFFFAPPPPPPPPARLSQNDCLRTTEPGLATAPLPCLCCLNAPAPLAPPSSVGITPSGDLATPPPPRPEVALVRPTLVWGSEGKIETREQQQKTHTHFEEFAADARIVYMSVRCASEGIPCIPLARAGLLVVVNGTILLHRNHNCSLDIS